MMPAFSCPSVMGRRGNDDPLRVVERADVGVAQAGGLDVDDDLARTGVGFLDVLQGERSAVPWNRHDFMGLTCPFLPRTCVAGASAATRSALGVSCAVRMC
ncbi:hypothetical protein GCM10022221_31800 [Actinocorallia aurea]